MSPWIYALLGTELIWIVAVFFLLVAAFRVSLKWGLISFFVPFGILVFTIKYWHVAGTRFLVSLGSYLAFLTIFATHLDVIMPILPPQFAQVAAAFNLPSSSDPPPVMDKQQRAAAAAAAEAQLAQHDELLEREAAYRQHAAELNATFAQLTAARAKLKGGGPALAAYNAKVAKYQASLARLQTEKAGYDALQHTVSAADAAANAATRTVANVGSNAAVGAPGNTPATRAEMDAAVARIRAIVNQVPSTVTKPANETGWIEGFHPGATKPDFDHTDIVSGRKPYTVAYIQMEGAPNVFYRGADCEFNSETKFFYTNRELPKKKLSDSEYQELVRLYRFVGKCQRDLGVIL